MLKFWTVYIIRIVPIFFVISVGIAMLLYPGGNIHDPNQVGYVFTHNFLSELGRYVTNSGDINFFSQMLFNQAMISYLLVGIGFLFVPHYFKDDPFSYSVAWIGSIFIFIGSLFFAGVGFTPADLYFEPHVFFALNAFRLLVPGTFFYLIVLLRQKMPTFEIASLGFLCLSTIAYVIFQIVSGGPYGSAESMVQQATAQKIIVIINVASMLILSNSFNRINKRLILS